MTKSASLIINSSSRPSIGSSLSWLVVWLSRLLLLGIGSGLAWVVGTAIATRHPQPNPEKPLAVKMLQSPETETLAEPSIPTASVAPQETVRTQELQAQLQQLQTQLNVLRDRTGALETSLGKISPNEPLEARLQAISQQLKEQPKAIAPILADNANKEFQVQTAKLKVTLPSDVLFKGGYSVLSPQANLILDQVIKDLGKYQKATIAIAVHTDNIGQVEDNRELSFRRARAIEQYLARTLGKQYRWVAIGYGATRPVVANDSIVNRQRNRRIEITLNLE